ncbi:MAG: response regulator [Candidatus Limivivens sp.]|nr:response regulator [Candidatus Limivivens sp.]
MYRVLIVDDEPAVLDMEKRAIRKRAEDFEVVGEAYSVKQAIALYEELEPDVVLTDIKMPGESGIVLIEYITQKEKNTICVAVSGYADFDYVHDAFTKGALDYLLKPVEAGKVEELFLKIRKILNENTDRNLNLPKAKISAEEMVMQICEYVEQNLAGDNSIVTICSRFHISQPYLSKIFKKQKNCTFNEYVMNLKVEKAKVLLTRKDDYLIGEIASALGFSDQFYFSKVFKNIVGCTPREYRNQF